MEFTGPYRNLLRRIYERCVQIGWFGPEIDAPSEGYLLTRSEHRFQGHLSLEKIQSLFAYVEHYEYRYIGQNGHGKAVTVVKIIQDGRQQHFGYPPATPEQIAQTEVALGFPLPQILRDIYSQLANGGFGYGYGFIGCMGGANLYNRKTIEQGTIHATWKLSDRVPDGLRNSDVLYRSYDLPDRFIPWCAFPESYGGYYWIDGWTGHVYTCADYPLFEWWIPEEDPDNDISWAINDIVKPESWLWPQITDYARWQYEDTADAEYVEVDADIKDPMMATDLSIIGIHYEAPYLAAWIERWLASPLP